MLKIVLKNISLLFFILSLFILYSIITPPDENKNFTTAAINKEVLLTESLIEKFTTDFDCEYKITLKLVSDKFLPIQLIDNIELKKNGKIIKKRVEPVYANNGSYLVREFFDAKSGDNYELRINGIDKSLIGKTASLVVDVTCASPSVAMAFAKDSEKEIKTGLWLIFGIFVSLTILSGVFGFRRKASR